MTTPADLIGTYIRAKDENRPHLMAGAFAADALLTMDVRTDAISFPSQASGRDAISRVLVQDFAKTYENVYTFCLTEPPQRIATDFSCDWLVGMSVKADGAVRVGCGRYDWRFEPDPPNLVSELRITIEAMQMLPAAALEVVMPWLSSMPYPWCDAERMRAAMPEIEALATVRRYLSR
mgnify:CR=1 FL=1